LRVLVRTDSSVKIGIGHVMRCLTLSRGLRESGVDVEFICRNHKGNIIDRILEDGFFVHILELKSSHIKDSESQYSNWLSTTQSEDAAECKKAISNSEVDWLIVDHYAISEDWHITLKPHCKKIMVIDDLANRRHFCDLLLDQTFGRNLEDYQGLVPSSCRMLLGSQYALIHPDFIQWRQFGLKRREKFDTCRLLINMGGADNDNFTGKVLSLIPQCDLPINMEIVVVMGATFPHLSEIERLAGLLPFKIELLVNVHNMAEIMAHSDIAIGAPGSTTWERCCLGLPSILFVQAENQMLIAKNMEEEGGALVLNEAKNLCRAIHKFSDKSYYNKMSKTCSKIVDGLGLDRILNLLLGS